MRAELVVSASLALCAACGGPHLRSPSGAEPDATPPPAAPPAPPPGTCSGMAAQPLDSDWQLPFGGLTRVFHVHVPASYDPAHATPVVLDYHGFTSDAVQEGLLSLMNAKADTAGFIAVHPEGTGYPQNWNAGACCGSFATSTADDVGFTRAMLDALEAKLCVDAHRVFATGMSNGGFMSHRLGCEVSDRIAAVAPVAGVLGMPSCSPGRAVPVIEFHGTADPLVPFLGNPLQGFPAVQDVFTGWAARDGCTGQPVQTYQEVDSTCATYDHCSGGAEVTLCTVALGGHTWPGGFPVPPLGYTTPWLSATNAMWDFFGRHPLP